MKFGTKNAIVFCLLALGGIQEAFSETKIVPYDDPNVIISNLRRPDQFSLNGEWYFQEDPEDVGEQQQWFMPGKVRKRVGRVPLPWQLAFDDLLEYLGVGWYEREFYLPEEYGGRRVAIEFIGVDHECKIWVNGKAAGEHVGSLTSFKVDISDFVKYGENNTITLRVNDPEVGTRMWAGEQVVSFSGLWRDVYLEVSEKDFISDIYMIPEIDHDRATAKVEVTFSPKDRAEEYWLKMSILGPGGRSSQTTVNIDSDPSQETSNLEASLSLQVEDPVIWTLGQPEMYRAEITLLNQKGELVDTAWTEFGMRKIETRDRYIYLNNEPIYIVGGWLDPSPLAGPDEVNWAMPGPYEPLSDEEIQRDIKTAKSLNVNLVRRILRSIYPRFIYWTDRLGMLVWNAGPWVPPQGMANQQEYELYEDRWTDIVVRDRNHPSIVIWELFCESFGLGPWHQSKQYTIDLYHHVKQLDPTRLALDNACGRGGYDFNYIGSHPASDIDDIGYLGLSSTAWIQSVNEFREYCRYITEFGRPVTNSLLNNKTSRIFNPDKARRLWGGQDPWWFVAPEGITTYSSYLTGYEDRYYKWGLDEVFGDFAQFTEKSDWYQYDAIKYHSEIMRMNPEMTGYLSFLFDCIPHVIAAIDPFRDKKVFADSLRQIYAQDLIIVDARQRNYWSGETVRADVHFSHYGDADLEEYQVKWEVEGQEIKGEFAGPSLKRGEVRQIGQIEFDSPVLAKGETLRIIASLMKDTEKVSTNELEIRVFPRSYIEPAVEKINFVGASSFTVKRFEIMGYECNMGLNPDIPIAVCTNMNDEVKDYLEKGNKVLLLICDELDLIGFVAEPKIMPVEDFLTEVGLVLGGEEFHFGGIVGSHYIRKDTGLFERIPFDNPVSWPFHEVMPESVLIGLKPEHQHDILAGAYGSFFRNSPVDSYGNRHECEITGTIFQSCYGKGKLVISTYDLTKFLALEPVATIMTNDLIGYTASDSMPETDLKMLKKE